MPVPSRAWVVLYDTTGAQVALFDAFASLHVEHKVNSYDVITLTMRGDDARTALFALDSFVEVWRQVGPSVAYLEASGLHRVPRRELNSDRKLLFTSTARGYLDLLHRRHILYPAVTAFTLKSAPGETTIKQFVDENAGPGAGSALRYVNGVTPGLTVQPDGGLGSVWTGQTNVDNLLDFINDVAAITSVDFDIVRTGGANFVFRTYYPQRGVDRRASLAFAPELGNMVVPVYEYNPSEEGNVMAILGPGQDTVRRVVVLEGTDVGASPWNRCEATVDASSADLYSEFVTAGNSALADAQPKETFTFDVLATDVAAYGRDFAVGDIVTGRFRNISRAKKIVGVVLDISEGKETIAVTFSDLP